MTAVVGRCPMGCGETLFVGSGGYVTCSYLPCPDPCRASEMLRKAPEIRRLVDAATDVAIDDFVREHER